MKVTRDIPWYRFFDFKEEDVLSLMEPVRALLKAVVQEAKNPGV